MKKLVGKVAMVVMSCVFFTIAVPVLFTTAQNNLYFFGFGSLFVFFGVCLYLLLTSPFFKTQDELVEQAQELEPVN